MVEHLKQEGTSYISSDLLKMSASWSAQDFRQTGLQYTGKISPHDKN